jgi:hypothetical protein
MPACKSADPLPTDVTRDARALLPARARRVMQRASAMMLAGLLVCFSTGVLAAFTNVSMTGEIVEAELQLNAAVDLGLSAPAEEAVEKGIPLDVEFSVTLSRHRRFWWDAELGNWTLHRRIRFYALSEQYTVTGPDPDDLASFGTLADALRYMGTLKDLVLPLDANPGEGDYRVSVRARLDVEALPAPLRPVAYASPAWHLSSGWTTWTLHR